METRHIVQLVDAAIAQGGRVVLKDVQLRLAEGEFAYLIGKTGSGKSTLLKALYAALPLAAGRGIVAGFDLNKLTRKTIPLLRRRLGMVFQDFILLDDRSVFDNLDFVLRATGWRQRDERVHRIETVLEQVDLEGKGDKMPHELSGGEQQRVVIARALLNEPVLIIADEPTGNLDPDTADEILMLLRRLNKERHTAVLLATHDYRVIEQFPARIIHCRDGRIFDQQDVML